MSNSDSGFERERRGEGSGPESGSGGAAADDDGGARFRLTKPGGEPVRAGRNLPVAIASGVALGALVLLSLFPYSQAFSLITAAATVIGLRELNRAVAAGGARLALPPLAVGGVAMQFCAHFGGPEWLVGATALTAIGALAWRLRGGADGYVRDAAANLFTLCYLPFLLGTWQLLVAHPGDGTERLIAFIIVTISSDIGGYFAGILLGRHKMAPVISPNKTWEGFGGSVLACMAAGGLTVALMLDGPVWVGLVLGVAVVLAAIVGDLIESLIKRDLGIKDMGRFMPGHGGLMDRVDSLLIAGPVAWVVLGLLL
ncbi:phosphatidate cytidylyltransferase [Nocardiopsis halophila]|uniref:phosphatidate cytidylyltransferase n=1 Tax=Nocardiopsis halophila TaxID=141692 RepID=UPI00034890E0